MVWLISELGNSAILAYGTVDKVEFFAVESIILYTERIVDIQEADYECADVLCTMHCKN